MTTKPTYEELEQRAKELEQAEEALQDKNEEYEALNEELRSSVEELQAATEELQAQNEELQQAEAALQQEQLFSKSIIDSLPNIFFLYSYPECKLISWNKRHETDLGYTADELKDRYVMDFHTPENNELIITAIKTVMEAGYGSAEDVLVTKDGRKIPYFSSAVRFESKGKLYFMGICENITERKRAEEALRESEERHRTILQTAMDGFWLVDLDGRLMQVNEAYCQMSGYSEPELLGMHILDLEASETPDEIAAHIQKTMAQGEERFETRHCRKDGSIFDVEISIQYWPTEGGRFVVFLRDITERKRAEEALRQSEKLHKEAQRVAHIGHWELYPEIGTPVWSDEIFRIFGLNPQEREPSFADHETHLHPDDWPLLKKAVALASAEGTPFDITFRLVRPDSEIKWMHAIGTTTKDEKGKVTKLFGTAQDITNRKQAEEALRESEEKFRNFTEQSFVGFYIIQDGLFKYVNPKFAEIFGYTVDECLDNMCFRQLVYPEDLATVEEQVARRIAGETNAVQYAFRGIKKTGEIIHVSIYGSSLDSEGRPAAIGTMLDITKELELEKRVLQSQKMEAIGTLAGGIAHDFNNILFPIVGYTEMLIDEADKESVIHDRLNVILNSAMRARGLVQQILAFSRQQEQKLKPLKAEIIVKEALKLMRASLPSTIEINLDIADDCGVVVADPTNIHQIIMNLCTNAYHAMEKTGGRLGVTLSRVESMPEDVVGTDRDVGPYLCLKVEDTGHGIEKEVMDRIFDPYYTTKEKGKGTGLGLAVVHGIVHSYGGAIRVQSEIGVGTVFQLFLPSIKTETPILETESISGLPKGNEKILVVDDEENITKLAKEMLGKLGYEVTTYTSSSKALLAFRRNPEAFDLVITDMTMPHMTGDEMALEMMKVRPDIPVILCTGHSEIIKEEEALTLGLRGFLLKPIQGRIFAEKIREVLDEQFLSSK